MKIIGPIIAVAVFCLAIVLAKPSIEVFWVSFMDFTNPKYADMKSKEWSNKSTDFLIGKLGHPASIWDSVAGNILAERKDLSKEDAILKIIYSDSSIKKRSSALRVLFFWNENKAFHVAMEILRSGKTHPLYDSALGKLAYRKYDPAYSYVVDLAEAADRYTNGSVSLLEKYGKLESLPILEKMLASAKTTLDERVIKNAIQSIKEKNGIKS